MSSTSTPRLSYPILFLWVITPSEWMDANIHNAPSYPARESVTLRDAAGHTFHQTYFSCTSTTLDTRNLPSSTYFLTLANPKPPPLAN